MDIGVTNAIKVREHRHAGFVLHAFDQRTATAWDHHIDLPLRAQQLANDFAILHRHKLHGIGGKPCFL